jgi:hypothetical protein
MTLRQEPSGNRFRIWRASWRSKWTVAVSYREKVKDCGEIYRNVLRIFEGCVRKPTPEWRSWAKCGKDSRARKSSCNLLKISWSKWGTKWVRLNMSYSRWVKHSSKKKGKLYKDRWSIDHSQVLEAIVLNRVWGPSNYRGNWGRHRTSCKSWSARKMTEEVRLQARGKLNLLRRDWRKKMRLLSPLENIWNNRGKDQNKRRS